jgi:hypothetical protein
MVYKTSERKRAQNAAWAKAHQEESKVKNAEYYLTNREKRLAQNIAWARAHPKSVRRAQLKARYGLTIEAWNAMLVAQCGRCASCGDSMTGKNEPCVDHNHETGNTRGLLCHPCNKAIGLLRDNSRRAQLATDYLKRHGC